MEVSSPLSSCQVRTMLMLLKVSCTQFFEIDSFQNPVSNLVMMETKGVTAQETVNFPPFIRVLEDVTGNPKYLNYNIALRR